MSPEQRELYNLAIPGVRSYAATVPQRFQGEQVAGFTDPQTQGQQAILAAAPTIGSQGYQAAGTNSYWLSPDAINVANNPNLGAAVDAATRPIWQRLDEQTLPADRAAAISAGGFGGSRQGVAEALDTRNAMQSAGDTAAKVVEDLYSTDVNAQLRALGLLPTVQQGLTREGSAESSVGDVQQAQNQAYINEAMANFNYDQMAPFLQAQDIMSLISGIPGGTSTAVGSIPQTSALQRGLGGAATGASLGSAFGPWGAALGGLGGGAIGFFS